MFLNGADKTAVGCCLFSSTFLGLVTSTPLTLFQYPSVWPAMQSVSDWDNEYARLARIAAQLRSRGGSAGDLQSLNAGLARLQRSLTSLPLHSNEIARRRRLITHLLQNPQLAQQDEMINDLAVGVERLKHQSMLIGDEAKMHLGLLNDMENQVDIAQSGMEAETRRADQLREQRSIWKLQMTVVALSVVLVLLILTGLT